MTYDFTTLDPSDFEALVADLLSHSWGSRLESFKPGKDGGIDLRHSRAPVSEPMTIVQCKRYAPHKFVALLRDLRKELEKLERLRPERYVLATSVSLSPANKDKLLATLDPWCKSSQDIYGPDELNGLLRDFPEVERAHFKLWISSTAVLERVLHAKIFAVTDATVESTKQQLSRLVVHGGLNKALDLLHEQHHVLIVGNPGIGKTTLARMLMCYYMQEEYEPVWIVGNVEDAWTAVHSATNTDRKLVVVYDDFLGTLQFNSERFGKNEDHSLMKLFDKVAHSPNLRFILTTREYILEDAKRVHGAFDSRADEIVKYTLTLADYAKAHKAQMLFNHLYFSDLPNSRLRKLVKKRVYRDIITHEHFNPRIVESISKYANSRAMNDNEYISFVEQEFDNPSKLWEHPYRRDINPMARQLLAVLWGFGGNAELTALQSSVAKMQAQLPPEDFALQFHDALRQLDGNFVSSNRYPGRYAKNKPFMVVQFQNPSVKEFVERVVTSEPSWLQRLVKTVVSIGQVTILSAQARKVAPENALPLSFWNSLRSIAATCEHVSIGRLINYQEYGAEKSRLTWSSDSPMSADVTKELLALEAESNFDDERSRALKTRVLTREGWTEHIADAANDDSVPYAATRLEMWVVKSSGWNDDDKNLSEASLRDALVAMLTDDDKSWPIRVSSLCELAKAATLINTNLTDIQRQAFAQATNVAVQTNIDNTNEADDLNSEADEIDKLEKILGLSLSTLATKLRIRAEEIEERHLDKSVSNPEQHRYLSEPVDEFDIDGLFDGLLDR